MAQRINPNIFQLGKNKEWKSKYFEKKSSELAKYAFKDSEIRKYVHKFLGDNGLIMHDCRLYYIDSALYIFVSYYLTIQAVVLVNKLNRESKIRLNPTQRADKKNKKIFRNAGRGIKTYLKYQRMNYKKKMANSVLNKPILNSVIGDIQQEERVIKQRRVKILTSYKKYLTLKKHKTIKNVRVNFFLNQLLEGLNLFTGKKLNIFLTFQQLNETVKKNLDGRKIQLLRKNLAQLRKYSRNDFFKDGVNLLYTCASQPDSSALLAQFVARELEKLKRHNFFLRFLKTTLTLFSNKEFSTLRGIKIKVKGRFNGAPRARYKTIKIGNVPVLTLDSNISYAEATSYTSNGTFGVKVWICAGTQKR
jgi:ribosomal protein S3